MSKISYTRAKAATTESKFGSLLKSSGPVDLSNMYSQMKVMPLFKPLLLCIFLALTVAINALFARKTRILVEPNPYNEGAKMLRLIKKVVKLVGFTVFTLWVALMLSLGAIIALLIQLLAR